MNEHGMESTAPPRVADKPDGWPDKCGGCGADRTNIGFDNALGFNCRACGRLRQR